MGKAEPDPQKSYKSRKTAEARQKLAIQVLDLLNKSGEKAELIRGMLLLIKEFEGFEVVGIRLKEGDDFPYYEANGFPVDFVEDERYLCAHDETGEVIRDSEGKPLLECMCGTVISGKTDPCLPFFTEGGSFWTNSPAEFLVSTTEEDRQGRTRNRCYREGYKSVALIPLRSGTEIIGLLQLNDRRKDMFTLEMITFFEGIGASIGIALAHKGAEEALQRERDNLVKIFEAMEDGVYIANKEYDIQYVNPVLEKEFGPWKGRKCYE